MFLIDFLAFDVALVAEAYVVAEPQIAISQSICPDVEIGHLCLYFVNK